MCMVVCLRENAPVVIIAADIKRSFWAALTAMKDCRSQCAWQCVAVCRAWPRGAGSAASTYPLRWLRKKTLNFTRRSYRPPHCRVDASSLVFLQHRWQARMVIRRTQHTQRLPCGVLGPRHRIIQGGATIALCFDIARVLESRSFVLVFTYADKLVAQHDGCASSTSHTYACTR